jgi:hypothetical protein
MEIPGTSREHRLPLFKKRNPASITPANHPAKACFSNLPD